jgi:hypothetical protein
MKSWWRRHRPDAPHRFEQELRAVLGLVLATPDLGRVFEQEDLNVWARRVLMPRTRNHIYYSVTATELVVLTVWGAPQGRGPKL